MTPATAPAPRRTFRDPRASYEHLRARRDRLWTAYCATPGKSDYSTALYCAFKKVDHAADRAHEAVLRAALDEPETEAERDERRERASAAAFALRQARKERRTR